MDRRTSLRNIVFLSISSLYLLNCKTETKYGISIDELEQHKSLLPELAETIIPRTNTPGAKDAKVEDFIILMVKDCDNKKNQRNFLNGLAKLKDYAGRTYHVEFVDCSDLDKIAVLNHFKKRNSPSAYALINKIKRKLFGYSFYTHLHELTVMGFCTSELGATQVLRYDHIPVRYEGCIPFQMNQPTWAT